MSKMLNIQYFIVPVLQKKNIKGWIELIEYIEAIGSQRHVKRKDIKEAIRKSNKEILYSNGLISQNDKVHLPPDYIHYLREMYFDTVKYNLSAYPFMKLIRAFKTYAEEKAVTSLSDINLKSYVSWFKKNYKPGKAKRMTNYVADEGVETDTNDDLVQYFMETFQKCYSYYFDNQYALQTNDHQKIAKVVSRLNDKDDISQFIELSFEIFKNHDNLTMSVGLLCSTWWANKFNQERNKFKESNRLKVVEL